QFNPAGAADCDWVRGRHQSCCWRVASEAERKRCHCADALRDRHPGAVRSDLCMSRLLALRVLWSQANVAVDDGDRSSGVCAGCGSCAHVRSLVLTYWFVLALRLLAQAMINSTFPIVLALILLTAFISLAASTLHYLTIGNIYTALGFFFVCPLFHAAV